MKQQLTFKEMLDKFLKYREISGFKKTSSTSRLIKFYRDCTQRYCDSIYLTQEMINYWCAKRDTEAPNSYNARICIIRTFIQYGISCKWLDLKIPTSAPTAPRTYIPHSFSENELINLFNACDNIKAGINIQGKLRKIEVPAFFRLLYSSGLRTTEARLLRKEDVNLLSGVINVRHTKGYNEHRVVLHDTMKDLLISYDQGMEKFIPHRKIFFPAFGDKCHTNRWVVDLFNEMWYKYNEVKTRAYDLRHNYAIENINKWKDTGYEIHDRLVSLSKSMGHRKLESTIYYYSLVPKLADIIENISGKTFNEIIPDLPEDEE